MHNGLARREAGIEFEELELGDDTDVTTDDVRSETPVSSEGITSEASGFEDDSLHASDGVGTLGTSSLSSETKST